MKRTAVRSHPAKHVAPRALTAADFVTLARVATIGVIVELGVRLLPLAVIARILGVTIEPASLVAGAAPTRSAMTDRQRRTVQLARWLMRHWPWGAGPCLRQALVIAHLLRALEPRLRLGVRRVNGRVEAHAWVEVPGMINTGGQGFEAFEWTRAPVGGTRP